MEEWREMERGREGERKIKAKEKREIELGS